MKKMMVVAVMILAMLAMVPAMSLAAGGWVTCNVISAGCGAGRTCIQLTETAVPGHFPAGTYFSADPVYAKEQLATALTAISLGKTVFCNLAGFTTYSNVNVFYINQ